jgi:predicted acylesterase/phospholipase RssA
MKRVLSIDGGGIRGLIPAAVCRSIENWSKLSIHQLFDLIAGTSTGGIIAMGLTLPPQGIRAEKLVEFYKTEGRKIFSSPRGVLRYLYRPKFENTSLIEAATGYFGMHKVSEAVTDVLVTTYDIEHRGPFYISRRKCKGGEIEDYLMRDVAVATAAAPTYFPPVRLGTKTVIDGGIVANNPACLAYAEAKQLWPDEEILLVSLGTGRLTPPIFGHKAAQWGAISWTRPLIDCVFDGTAKATEDFFRYTHMDRYVRVQGDLSELTETLDSVTEAGLIGLEQIGDRISRDREGELFRLIDELKRVGLKLSIKIDRPYANQIVRPGECIVEGTSQNFSSELLYLFTGEDGRYWPSARIIPKENRWQGKVNLGARAPTGTITLVAVDIAFAEYIEFYRSYAGRLEYPGLRMQTFPKPLDQIKVVIDHKE